MLKKEFDPHGSDTHLGGIKIAEVIDNNDPKCCERVLVRVIGVHDMSAPKTKTDYAIWADHCAPSKNRSGDIPEKGDFLYVMFPDLQDPMRCVWLGWVRHMR